MSVIRAVTQVPLQGIIVSREYIQHLSGDGDAFDPAWFDSEASPQEGVRYWASLSNATPPVASDKDSNKDVITLAKALAWTRHPAEEDFVAYPQEIQDAIAYIVEHGLEVGSENEPALALARNVTSFVLAADVIDLATLNPELDTLFRAWLSGPVRTTVLHGRTLISTHEDRPNNFGTHAGAARMAIAVYLSDIADLTAAITVFKGWLGDRNAYAGFNYGALHWQADEDNPVGINPAGATKLDSLGVSRDIDGVLPDDQRRGSGPSGAPPSFMWDAILGPAKTNYVYEALQGVVLQACIVARAMQGGWGLEQWDPWAANDEAIRRAFEWLNDAARGNFPVNNAETGTGDDYWLPHVINEVYGTALTAPTADVTVGKAFGFANWFTGGNGVAGFHLQWPTGTT